MLIRRLAAPFLALALLVPSLSRAHIAEFEATLDTAQEVPSVTGTATGTGTFILEEDGTLITQVTFQSLTGVPNLAHIHEAPVGVSGTVIVDYTSFLPGGMSTSGTITAQPILTEAQQAALLAGNTYFNIHTPQHPAGEIRGQIRLKQGPCSCDAATAPGKFKACVKKAIRNVEKEERGEDAVKALRRMVAKSACGRKKTPKRLVACCLPLNPAQNIVTDRMCAVVKEKQCSILSGTSLGRGVPCSPTPCGPSSPAAAFLAPRTN